jgi:hypothetical protein
MIDPIAPRSIINVNVRCYLDISFRLISQNEQMPDQVLERLAHYPGISSQLEMIDVATPYAWWRYTRNYKGAYEVGS